MSDNDIRRSIRGLIANYGLPTVHAALQAEMRETYEFLRQMFEPPKNNLVIPIQETIPDRIATPIHKPMATMVIAMEPPHLELSPEEDVVEDTSVTVEKTNDPSLKEVVIQAKKEMNQEVSEKFSKAKHREEVAKKHKELVETGVRPESLLTKENLTKWLGEGLSYMRIAREHVGVHENEIAAVAKTFGLQSDVKKYIVMKKGAK